MKNKDKNKHVFNPGQELNSFFKKIATILILAVLLVSIGIAALYNRLSNPNVERLDQKVEVFKFSSEQEFKDYIANSQMLSQRGGATFLASDLSSDLERQEAATPDRVSETNIQVQGVDEPDIAKTDGQTIFYSSYFNPTPIEPLDTPQISIPSSRPAPVVQQNTKVLSAFPPETLNELAQIEEPGQLLLTQNQLIFISHNTLTAYDVSDPASPQKTWSHSLDDQIVLESRLKDGQLYVVTQKNIHPNTPCPIPIFTETNSLTIACTDIYRPNIQVPTNTLHTVLKFDPANGSVDQKISFTASFNSVVYMSNQNIFITNANPIDFANFQIKFFETAGDTLLPPDFATRIRNLKNLNISNIAKSAEIEVILGEYRQTLSQDEALKFQTNYENTLSEFSKNNSRDFEKTIITRIETENLKIAATGQIPGSPLNQFSLDEYNSHLRIATTTGANNFIPGFTSTNDIYVLDDNLNQVGSIKDLGLDERIYSARFVGEIGYLVTFEQIDPFFTLDLSNPQNPRKTGELKIPGFSSYLHPIDNNLVVGVGREEGRVKIALFNVSDKNNPTEADTFYLTDSWTQIDGSHHAFLLDKQHSVFFLPAGQNGYIISYQDNQLSLAATVAGTNAQRAIFINDFLYILGTEEIVVLNENTWEQTNSLPL